MTTLCFTVLIYKSVMDKKAGIVKISGPLIHKI